MLKLVEFARQLFLLTHETQQNKADIKEVRQELKEIRGELQRLVIVVQKLSFDIQRVGENDHHEREKLSLQLQNELLQFERRLPSAKDE
jgi:hypothetical protein